MSTDNLSYFDQILARKEAQALRDQLLRVPDSLQAWMAWYLRMTILGVREQQIAKKIARHLERFRQFLLDRSGHEQISTVLKRDVLQWQTFLDEDLGLARSTTNNHLSSLSGFTSWMVAHHPTLFAMGNPCAGLGELPLPELSLTDTF